MEVPPPFDPSLGTCQEEISQGEISQGEIGQDKLRIGQDDTRSATLKWINALIVLGGSAAPPTTEIIRGQTTTVPGTIRTSATATTTTYGASQQ